MRVTIAAWRGVTSTALAGVLLLAQNAVSQAQSDAPGLFGTRLDVDASIGYLYDDNVTRAPSGPDKLSDQFFSLSASKTFAFPVTDFTRLTVEAFGGGELALKYSDLGNVFGGIQAAVQHRGSTEFDAPTFSLFARGLGEHFGSSLRSGYRFSAGISARQPITESLGVFGALARNWRNADNSVFDTHENSALVSVDYSIAPHGALTFTTEYRRGTLVSTGQRTLTIVDIAQAFVNDDVFTSPQLIDYRFEAKSWMTTLDYNLPINASSALDLSWRRVQSTSTEKASFPGGGSLKYVDNQFNILLLVRF